MKGANVARPHKPAAQCFDARVLKNLPDDQVTLVRVNYKPNAAVNVWIPNFRSECVQGAAGNIMFSGKAAEMVRLAIQQDKEARREARRLG